MTILDLPKLSRRYQPTGQTWLISMYCSHKKFHFLNVSEGPTSILSDIISLRKSHQIIFVKYFRKTKNTCKRYFWDVSDVTEKTSFLRYAWDVLKTSQKNIFFEMYLRRLKDVTKKTSFLRCIWDLLKTSQKRHIFWDVFETS